MSDSDDRSANRPGVTVFDVDRTLTRRPTYARFLWFALWRLHPWRVVLIPLLAPRGLLYALGLTDRDRMKAAMHRVALGGALDRARARDVADAFAAREAARGLYRAGRRTLDAERAAGRRVVLATAAPELYIAPLAAALGVADVIASRATWIGDRLSPRIAGTNCYGAEKARRVMAWMADQGIARNAVHLRFYSDHASDAPLFDDADDPVSTNPSPALRRLAAARGWRIVDWAAEERA